VISEEAHLTLGQYLGKIGVISLFLLIDLIFFPSLVQTFIPISMDFFFVWAFGVLLLLVGEKKILDKILPRKIASST
jgi:hypothetical protein